MTLKTFANGEVYCRYEESIRGADVFIVQSTCANEQTGMTPNDALMEMLTMIDAAQGASAHRIIAVMPWYGYARQDKKSAPREPISARIVAKTLEGVGVDRILTMDLHAGQVQGFFHVPVDHMTAMPMLTQWFIDQELKDELVIVSPDAGRVKTARNFARRVGTHWAVMEKERPAQQVAEIGYVVGDVKGKTAVLVDDMIDTAGTLCAAAQTVLDEGAARVIACATHGVFSGPAFERIADSAIERIVVTDTLPLRPGAPDNITVLSTASTFADSIRRIFTDDSVSRDLRRREPALLAALRLVGHKGADALVARQHGRELREGGRGRGRHDRVRRALAAGLPPAARAAGAAGRRPRLGGRRAAHAAGADRGARRLPRAAAGPGRDRPRRQAAGPRGGAGRRPARARPGRAGDDLDDGDAHPETGARAGTGAAPRLDLSQSHQGLDPKRWAKAPMAAALVGMRYRLPGLAAEKLPKFGVAAMWVYHPLVSPRLARICELAGVELIAWTVDEEKRMRTLVEQGVTGLFSNDPRLFARLELPSRYATRTLAQTVPGVAVGGAWRPPLTLTADSSSSSVKPPTASPSVA